MLDCAIQILNILEKNGFVSYIVGGYVRDFCLNIESNDIDICTSATPEEISNIFNIDKSYERYGAVKLNYGGYKFDLTTFREDSYKEGKLFIKYAKDINKDVIRRDFTINSLYMDKNKRIIDPLNSKEDIELKIIRCIGNSDTRINEDPIRILRAIRYSITLNFKLDYDLENAIKKNKNLLSTLSNYKLMEELNKAFSNSKCIEYLKVIKELNIDKCLNLKYDKVNKCSDPLGVWAQVEFDSRYVFRKKDFKIISEIREILKKGCIDNYTVYKYTYKSVQLSSEILNISKEYIEKIDNELPIRDKKDIKVNIQDICEILNIEEKKAKNVLCDIEKLLVYNKINNDYDELKDYIIKKYKENIYE